jgi:alpha-tubulin suppressor-like RCC1 family protein
MAPAMMSTISNLNSRILAYYPNESHVSFNKMKNKFSVFKGMKIADVCCNDFAAHFLTEDGLLYTMGRDQKKYGLLGLGAVYDMPTPHPNNSLIDFRISKIAMGLSHCCALTTSGQMYTWGTGQNGQLCLSDETMFSNIPKLVVHSK